MRVARIILVLSCTLTWLSPSQVLPCSSFSLLRDGTLVVGRNLDANSHTPGLLVVNKRGVEKTGRSFQWLVSGQCDAPPISWISKYGSLTFNTMGVEFPESGVNEAGLCIEEMSLLETEYPSDSGTPTLFMQQWIQYLLDTCATVDDVVRTAQAIALDGWSWHFYAVDKSGSSAVIEFLAGEPVIRTGETLPQPLLCNSIYDEELEQLGSYRGFGGNRVIDLDDPGENRFAQGAYMLADFAIENDPITYGFMILDTMSRGTTKWAKIVDLGNLRVTLRTDTNPQLRHIDLDTFDYSCETPRLILDIHADLRGDLRPSFTEYTAEAHRTQVEESIASLALIPQFDGILESLGGTRDGMTRRFSEYPDTTCCSESLSPPE